MESSSGTRSWYQSTVFHILSRSPRRHVFLIHSEVLDKVNHTTIAILFDYESKILRIYKVKWDRILLFAVDSPLHATSRPRSPNAIPKSGPLNNSCDDLHVVAGDILGKYPEVDNLISNIKKIFLKAPLWSRNLCKSRHHCLFHHRQY